MLASEKFPYHFNVDFNHTAQSQLDVYTAYISIFQERIIFSYVLLKYHCSGKGLKLNSSWELLLWDIIRWSVDGVHVGLLQFIYKKAKTLRPTAAGQHCGPIEK